MTKQEPAGLNTTYQDVMPLSEVIKEKNNSKINVHNHE